MSPQPIRKARRFSIGQKIDGFAVFEIDTVGDNREGRFDAPGGAG